MNKTVKFINLTIVSCLLVFSSCGTDDPASSIKNSPEFNMIASIDNLMIVGSVDFISLIEKSGFVGNDNTPAEVVMGYKMMVESKLDPEETGIDLTGNNYFALSMIEENKPDFGFFSAKIVDQTKVKKSIKAMGVVKGKYSKEEIDGNEYEFFADDEVVIGWDAKNIVLVASKNNDAKELVLKLLKARYVDAPANEGLSNYLEEKDDMNMYVDLEQMSLLAKNTKDGENLPQEIFELNKDAYYIGKGNFNNGEIVFEIDFHADKFKNSEYNIFPSNEPVSDEYLKYLTTNEKLMMFGLAKIDMSIVYNLAEMYSKESNTNLKEIAAAFGATTQDLEKLFTGEFSASLIDVKSEKVSYATDEDRKDDFFNEDDYSYTTSAPVYAITAGIRNSELMEKFFAEVDDLVLIDGVYKDKDKNVYIKVLDDKVVFASDSLTLLALTNPGTLNDFDIKTTLTTPLYGFINTDLSTIPNGIRQAAEEEGGQMALEFSNLFELVDFNGEFEKFVFKAELKNKTENALKVITDYALSVAKKEQLF